MIIRVAKVMTSIQSLMVRALYTELVIISFLQASHDPRVHAEISAITGHIKKQLYNWC